MGRVGVGGVTVCWWGWLAGWLPGWLAGWLGGWLAGGGGGGGGGTAAGVCREYVQATCHWCNSHDLTACWVREQHEGAERGGGTTFSLDAHMSKQKIFDCFVYFYVLLLLVVSEFNCEAKKK